MMSSNGWHIYIVRCHDDTLYTGITNKKDVAGSEAGLDQNYGELKILSHGK